MIDVEDGPGWCVIDWPSSLMVAAMAVTYQVSQWPFFWFNLSPVVGVLAGFHVLNVRHHPNLKQHPGLHRHFFASFKLVPLFRRAAMKSHTHVMKQLEGTVTVADRSAGSRAGRHRHRGCSENGSHLQTAFSSSYFNHQTSPPPAEIITFCSLFFYCTSYVPKLEVSLLMNLQHFH
jgi:hypothetical protein